MRHGASISVFFFGIFLSLSGLDSVAEIVLSPQVNILKNKEGLVTLSFLKSCQNEFSGILIQDLDTEYRLGVLLKSQTTNCAAMPRLESLSLEGFRFDPKRPLMSLQRSPGKGKLRFLSVESLDWDPAKPDKASLTFYDQCEDFVGLVYRQKGDIASLGALSYDGKDKERKDKACKPSSSWTPLGFLPKIPKEHIKLIYPTQKAQMLDLSLVLLERETDPKIRGLSASAEIPCDANPLGLALLAASDRQSQSIALLIARRSGGEAEEASPACSPKSPSRKIKYSLSTLSLASAVKASSEQQIKGQPKQILLKSPIIAWEKNLAKIKAFVAKTSCEKILGQVFAVDENSTLAMGVLLEKNPSSKNCKSEGLMPFPVPEVLSFDERPIPLQIF